MKMSKIVGPSVILSIVVLTLVSGSTLFAQTNSDEIVKLKERVAELEKKVEDISRFLEPLKGQQDTITTRRKALQDKITKRYELDRTKYSQDQLMDAETTFSVLSQKGGQPEAKQSLDKLIKDYPECNRTGCAMLYTAQRAQGEERVKLLQTCIDKYGDCVYGDAVQVGAFARYILAREYIAKGDMAKADALAAEIKRNYPGAIDHSGNLLLDLQGKVTR
jgi:regulator of replication initiation timing